MPLYEIGGKRPQVDSQAFVAPTAVLIGDVQLGAGASVWFGAVLRGDSAPIAIGEGSNVQDNAVIHTAVGFPTLIGRRVTVGHGAVLEGCIVEDEALVGMGSIMLHGARLSTGAVLAAGAVLTEGTVVPPGQSAAGIPARVRGAVDEATANRWIRRPAGHYVDKARNYRDGLAKVADDNGE